MMKDMRLEKSDVVFMYVPKDTNAYLEYQATVSAWGGSHSQATTADLLSKGVHPTGTMWCLTAGARNLHADPDLRDAVVRDVEGTPIAVPWLHDHTYEGTPSWWGCANHPAFRAHMRKEVCRAMAGGALGLHVDDHLSNAHPAAWEGGCFCRHCMRLFAAHMKAVGTFDMLRECGLDSWEEFDYRKVVARVAPTREECKRLGRNLPLYEQYVSFQVTLAAENLRQLHRLAEEIAGRKVTISANTGLPSILHTAVTPYLSYMVGEVDQGAPSGTGKLMNAVRAYRMADTLGKPIAATASGHDWDHILETGKHRLATVWVALAYACGQLFMVPNHMWCYSTIHGTRWYDGPTGVFAPLYRFVRGNRRLFDGLETRGPLAPPKWANDGLDTPAKRESLRKALDDGAAPLTAFDSEGKPAAWVFPRESNDRVPSGAKAVVHVVNTRYDEGSDAFAPAAGLRVAVPRGVFQGAYHKAMAYAAGGGDATGNGATVPLDAGGGAYSFVLPSLGLWTVVELA